jgi:hypothetical protein
MRATSGRAGTAAGALLLLLAACAPATGGGDPVAPTPPRAGRFGSLRDFVLLELGGDPAAGAGGRLFVDRFEVTRGDWAEFAGTAAGRAVAAESAALLGDPGLPVGLVDLRQARAFARWRFARLPTRAEWQATAQGGYAYPWGNKVEAARANTADLGLHEPTLVGLFEAGRRDLGPYDLIGNVSEWSESVSAEWCDGGSLVLPTSFHRSRRVALRTGGLALWQCAPGVMPPEAIAAARPGQTLHDVLGADFQSPMEPPIEAVQGGDRRLCTGLRLVARPGELLAALLRADVAPGAGDLLQLERFVARGTHRAALRAAWPAAERAIDPARRDGALLRQLRGLLQE